MRAFLRTACVFAAAAFILEGTRVHAADVPSAMNFQGRLLSEGQPVTGTRDMTFRIYGTSSGSDVLWTETQTGISVDAGVFSVQLGAVGPLPSTIFAGDLYLEIEVGAKTFSPRERLVTSPYAFNAQRLQGKDLSDFVIADSLGNVGIGTSSPDSKLSVDVAGDNIGYGWKVGADTYAGASIWSSNSPNRRLHFSAYDGFDFGVGANNQGEAASAVRIGAQGYVGIGTTSPAYDLDVAGSVNASGYWVNGQPLGGGGSLWTESGSNVYRDSGNVGVGTTSPTQKLHVMGNITLGTAGGTAQYWVGTEGYNHTFGGNSGAIGMMLNQASGSGDIRFMTHHNGVSNSVRMVIDIDGKVGIGTTSPSEALHVAGTVKASAFDLNGTPITSWPSGGSSPWSEGSGNVYRTGGRLGLGTASPSSDIHILRTNTSINVSLAADTGNAGQGSFIRFGAGGTNTYKGKIGQVREGSYGIGRLAFFTSPDSSGSEDNTIERMSIKSNGNVGIGTTSPQYLLEINAAKPQAESALKITSGHSATGSVLTIKSNGGSTNVMDILGSGNVGLGTTDPSSKLDVAGTVKATAFDLNGSEITSWPSGGGGGLWTASGSNIYRTGGSVGIGTASPQYLLEINAAKPDTESALKLTSGHSATGSVMSIKSAGGSTNVMEILGSGNVGIGTTNPTEKLHIQGDIAKIAVQSTHGTGSAAISAIEFYDSAGTLKAWLGDGSDTNEDLYIRSYSGAIHFGDGAGWSGLNLTNGNAGIGTTSPTEKLDVVGTVKATAFVGDGSGLTGVAGGSPWTENSGNVYRTSGGVGIGTSSPDAALSVVAGGGTSANPVLTVKGTSGSGYISITGNGAGTAAALLSAAHGQSWRWGLGAQNGTSHMEFYDATQGKMRMLLRNDGNVGIGTESPEARLEVYSDAAASATGQEVLRVSAENDGGIAGSGPYLTFDNGVGDILTGKIGNISEGSGKVALSFHTYDNGLSETMRINAAGNVGIGTASPSQKLDVAGQIRASGDICTDAGGGLCLSSAGGSSPWTEGSGLVYYNGGNVGIGIASPGRLVHIDKYPSGTTIGDGEILRVAAGGQNNDVAEIGFSNATRGSAYMSPALIGYRTISNASSQKGELYFATRDVTTETTPLQRMVITTDGKVGIGTTDPLAMLNVYSAAANTPILRLQTPGLMVLKIIPVDTATGGQLLHQFKMSSSEGLHFITNETKSTLAMNDGNVGIGTITPAYKLDVAGSAHASSFPTSSDRRFKTNVQPLENVLDKVKRMQGVSFEWNETYEKLGRSTGRREIGVIAQDVEDIFPQLVSKWGEGEYRAVDYGRLAVVLIEAIKEQQKQIEELKARLTPQ
ncbi:MAG: tail fiber domain-containing protein [Elusimicrobiota bacterium]